MPSHPRPRRVRRAALLALAAAPLTAMPVSADDAASSSPQPVVLAGAGKGSPALLERPSLDEPTSTGGGARLDRASRSAARTPARPPQPKPSTAAAEPAPKPAAQPQPAPPPRPDFARPTAGRVSQWFIGHDGDHAGIDIATPIGTPVLATNAGTVSFVGWKGGYGQHVEVTHPDGTVTTYSHLASVAVAVGQPVAIGQHIASSGNTGRSTGPHLHFEVHLPDGRVIDPAFYLRYNGVQL